jgi:ribosomal protein S2
MSAAKGVLSLQEEDLTKILVANAHLGSQNLDFQMEQYVFKRKNNGNYNNLFFKILTNSFLLIIRCMFV